MVFLPRGYVPLVIGSHAYRGDGNRCLQLEEDSYRIKRQYSQEVLMDG
jgi:hypothetical protein